MNKINWHKARCPVCRREYEYPEGDYKPQTCSDYNCVHEYIHHPEKYKDLMQLLDECRKELRI